MSDLITLPALTLYPEWAWAITHLDKRVENRPERIARMLAKRGGVIAIHAGMHVGGRPGSRATNAGMALLWAMAVDADCVDADRINALTEADEVLTSAVVAIARLGALVHPDEARPWQASGSWAVELAEVHVLARPVHCGGKQGLWPVQIPRDLPPAWALEARHGA